MKLYSGAGKEPHCHKIKALATIVWINCHLWKNMAVILEQASWAPLRACRLSMLSGLPI